MINGWGSGWCWALVLVVPSVAKVLSLMWCLRDTLPADRPAILQAFAAVYSRKDHAPRQATTSPTAPLADSGQIAGRHRSPRDPLCGAAPESSRDGSLQPQAAGADVGDPASGGAR